MSSRLWSLRSTRCAALGALLALCVTAAGCKSDDDDDHDHDGAVEEGEHSHDAEARIGTPSGATCPEGSTLSYDNFGKDFMDTYCVRCHSSKLKGDARMGAPEDHDFDIYEGIIGVAMHIDQYAAAGPDAINTMMPLASDKTGPKPTMEEREKLGEWLACELDMLE